MKLMSKICIVLEYSCPRGKCPEEGPLVVAQLKRLFDGEGFEVVEQTEDFQAWVVIDGSLSNAPADIEILRTYVEHASAKGSAFDFLPFPVVLSSNPAKWQHAGFRFPSEFLLPISRAVELQQRIEVLNTLHGSEISPPFCVAEFRDFVVGNFREKLGLDHSHHGTTSNLQNAIVDLKQLAERVCSDVEDSELEEKDLQILYAWGQGVKNADIDNQRSWPSVIADPKATGEAGLYRCLFSKRSGDLADVSNGIVPKIEAEVGKFSANSTRKSSAKNILEKLLPALDRAFPRWLGHGLASLPVSKLIGLVVDDQMDELLERLNHTQIHSDDASRPMSDLIDFHSAFEGQPANASYMDRLLGYLRNPEKSTVCPRCIDFVLLDLSFTAQSEGEQSGSKSGSWEDPLGWRMLPILRKWFPDIPIIIHSWFGSSTQVRLAYERGAEWFLEKDDDHKLPAHLFQLLEQPNWIREWNANSDVIFDLPPERPDKAHERFLWWKCMRDLPGDHIRIRPLGGGISSAVTAKAWRRIDGRYDRLPPMIIKIDHPFAMGMEYERYRRFIGPYLSNRAGRIHESPIHAGREHSAITYTCAGSSQGVSGSRNRTEILPLLGLLEMNLPRDSPEVLPFTRYEGLLRHLLDDTLPRIHNLEPHTQEDYPNLVFGEFEHPLDSYLARFPPTKKIDLKSPLKSAKTGGGQKLLLLGSNSKLTEIEAMILPDVQNDARIERVVLKGSVAAHYCRHRRLRRNQIVRVTDPLEDIQQNERWPQPHKTHHEEIERLVPGLSAEGIGEKLDEIAAFLREKGSPHFKKLRKGIIHGDLNLGNIMVERTLGQKPVPLTNEGWLIDFAWSRRDAIAIDFAQLEIDLLIRLGKPHVFRDTKKKTACCEKIAAFRDAYLETPWGMPEYIETIPQQAFLFQLMRQVRAASDEAGIDAAAYSHVRLAAMMITVKLRLKKVGNENASTADVFAAALALNWTLAMHGLLS